MINKRFQLGDRRQNNEMPRFPLKDSNPLCQDSCRVHIIEKKTNRGRQRVSNAEVQ